MSDDSGQQNVEKVLGASLRSAGRPDGSLFPVVGTSARDAHGRLEDVCRSMLSEDPPVELWEFRSLVDERERCDVTSSSNFYDWLHENIGKSATLPGLFKRNDTLIRVPRIGEDGWIEPRLGTRGDDGPAQIRPLTGLGLLDIIQHKFWVYKEKHDVKPDEDSSTGEREIIMRQHAMVPFDIARLPVDSPGEWKSLPNVKGVTHTPTMRHNFTVLDQAGYDSESEMLYLPDPDWQELKHPALGEIRHQDVAWSTKVLNGLVEDFPFEHDLHRLNYMALLLTPLMRAMTPPPYPMFIINAHQRGTGKSLLARVARELHGGVHRPELPTDSEEIRKQITSILTTTTAPIINFDNVTQPIRNGQIANLLTTPTWSDRPLGRTATVEAANDRIWIATGNNVQIGGDLARRVRYVSLDAVMSNPEYRTKFKINDLIGYTRANRGTYITALLIQLMWWVQAGHPIKSIRTDDYGAWEGSLAEILELGGLDPLGTFAAGERARGAEGVTDSVDEDELGALLVMLSDRFGGAPFQVKDIKKFYESPAGFDVVEDVLPFQCSVARGDKFKSLGRWMDGKNKSVAGGLRLVQLNKIRGGWQYRLEAVRAVDPTKE